MRTLRGGLFVGLVLMVFALFTAGSVAYASPDAQGASFPASTVVWRPWEHGSYLQANVGNCTSFRRFEAVTRLDTGSFNTRSWTAQGCVNNNREVKIGIPGSFVLWVVANKCRGNPFCWAPYASRSNWGVYAYR